MTEPVVWVSLQLRVEVWRRFVCCGFDLKEGLVLLYSSGRNGRQDGDGDVTLTCGFSLARFF